MSGGYKEFEEGQLRSRGPVGGSRSLSSSGL